MNDLRPDQVGTRLACLIRGVDLQALSRVPASRLQDTALPNIGLLELVSAEDFEKSYRPLYLSMFHGEEREKPHLITQRLEEDFAGLRSGLAPYRIVGIRNREGIAVGAAQFSILMLTGVNYAIPYIQYIYIRPENRRQDLSEVLHTITLAVATADANAAGESRTVPFTLFETEPPNHGSSQSSRANATQRTAIHTKSGSRALMLLNPSGVVCSSHVQPGLETGDRPVTLTWVIRPSPAVKDACPLISNEIGASLLKAYYRSLRDEGFPEENIALAERMSTARLASRNFIEMPLADITSDMYQNLEDSATLSGIRVQRGDRN